MTTVNGKDTNDVAPSSLIRRISSRTIKSEDKENGDACKGGFVGKYKNAPEALKNFHLNDPEENLEVPGTPATPRTSTTPGLSLSFYLSL